jgi:hypothetical protein
MPNRRKPSSAPIAADAENRPTVVVPAERPSVDHISPAEARPRSRQSRTARKPELIKKANKDLAVTHVGKILMRTLTEGANPDTLAPPRPLSHYYIFAQDLLGRHEVLSSANDLSPAERLAVLRCALALFEEETAPALADDIPSAAPALWSERPTTGEKTDPAGFVRLVYGRWIGRGLSRRRLRDLDPDLYRALSVWEHRHPEDRIAQLPTLAEEIDAKIVSLADEFTPDELRKLGSTLQTRHRRSKN